MKIARQVRRRQERKKEKGTKEVNKETRFKRF